MKKRISKISLGLGVLFMLDLLKPFNYWLATEFLFLGVIFVALNYPLRVAFVLGCVCGYFKDCLSYSGGPLNLIEFGVVVILVHYLRMRFHQKPARIMIVLGMLAIHAILNSARIEGTPLPFVFLFFIHSFWVFILINYILRKWARIPFEEYI